jgi:hypothetical protein
MQPRKTKLSDQEADYSDNGNLCHSAPLQPIFPL